jgi:hypothetical protein
MSPNKHYKHNKKSKEYTLNASVSPGGSSYECTYEGNSIEEIKKHLCYDLVFGGGIYHFAWYGINYTLQQGDDEPIDITHGIQCVFSDTLYIDYNKDNCLCYSGYPSEEDIKDFISNKIIHYFGHCHYDIIDNEDHYLFIRRVQGGYFIGRDFKDSIHDISFDLTHKVSKTYDKIEFLETYGLKYTFTIDWAKMINE